MTARPVRPREYSSHCLHLLWLTGPPAHLSDDVTSRVRQLGLQRRGCRCGSVLRLYLDLSAMERTLLRLIVHSLVGLFPEVAVVR